MTEEKDGASTWRFRRRVGGAILITALTVAFLRSPERDTLLPNIAGWTDDPVLGKDSGQKQSVFFYRENDGKGELKAYYTSDWQLGPLE